MKSQNLSFKISTSKHATTKLKTRNEGDDDIDYITSAEGHELKSQKPKKEKTKLVIPLKQKNNSSYSQVDKEAADELLRELKDVNDDDNGDSVAIPLLLKNRLPVNEESGTLDVKLMPEVSNLDDYESVPVTAFGAAMLRGMGWKEGQSIGLTNKGLAEPIEFIPRHKGLGLGAEKKQEEIKQRRRKLGERKNVQPAGPIVEKSGKVRHFKGISESVYKHPQGYVPGAFCLIERGAHEGIYGKIIAVDEDNARVTVKLTLGQQQATISQYYITLVSEDEYQTSASGKRKIESTDRSIEAKRKKNGEEDSKASISRKTASRNTPSWLFPNIRVRVISKSFRKGRFYYKKIDIVDIVSKEYCVCKTEDGKLIEDVPQDDLESVIPKREGSLVMVVDGKYKGQGFFNGDAFSRKLTMRVNVDAVYCRAIYLIGKLLDRNPDRCSAHVQLLHNKHITKLGYDSICEYLGKIGDDDFL
eukprot:gene6341-7067_t